MNCRLNYWKPLGLWAYSSYFVWPLSESTVYEGIPAIFVWSLSESTVYEHIPAIEIRILSMVSESTGFMSIFPPFYSNVLEQKSKKPYPEQSVHDIFNAIVQNEQKHRSAYIDQALRQQNNERDCNVC